MGRAVPGGHRLLRGHRQQGDGTRPPPPPGRRLWGRPSLRVRVKITGLITIEQTEIYLRFHISPVWLSISTHVARGLSVPNARHLARWWLTAAPTARQCARAKQSRRIRRCPRRSRGPPARSSASFLRVHWVAVPEELRARRANREFSLSKDDFFLLCEPIWR
eukprot:COSAG01_NODE_2384_length_7788_cov_8.398751_8_plen_163_part_00